jgi:Uma2 family endonuclease
MATAVRKSKAPIEHSPWPLVIRIRPALTLTEDQFLALCQLNRDLQIERTAEGDWSIMPPVVGSSGRGEASVIGQLWGWAQRDGTGTVFSSAAGFRLPNGAVRAPDASWVLTRRLEPFSASDWERFLPLCPDFVVELRSPSDRLADLQAKMAEYVASGTRLGWLLDSERRHVYVYRPGAAVERLNHPEKVSGEPVLPGFELDLRQVW